VHIDDGVAIDEAVDQLGISDSQLTLSHWAVFWGGATISDLRYSCPSDLVRLIASRRRRDSACEGRQLA